MPFVFQFQTVQHLEDATVHLSRGVQLICLYILNVAESKIKRIVGHKSLYVTEGVYTHYSPQDLLIEVKNLQML